MPNTPRAFRSFSRPFAISSQRPFAEHHLNPSPSLYSPAFHYRVVASKILSTCFLSSLPNSGPFIAQSLLWERVRDCISGQQAIHVKGDIYLPPREGQTADEYRDYLTKATFYNATRRTLDGLLGSVFRRPTTFENVPFIQNAPLPNESIFGFQFGESSNATSTTPKSSQEDDLSQTTQPLHLGVPSTDPFALNPFAMTQDGSSSETLIRRTVEEILTTGRYGHLVDIPQEPSTHPEPYVAEYMAEQVLGYTMSTIRGRKVLTMVLLLEAIDPDPSTYFADAASAFRQRNNPSSSISARAQAIADGLPPRMETASAASSTPAASTTTYYRLRVLQLENPFTIPSLPEDIAARYRPETHPFGIYTQRTINLTIKESRTETGSPQASQVHSSSTLLSVDVTPTDVPTGNVPELLTASIPMIPTKRGYPLGFIPFQFYGPKESTPKFQDPPLLDISDMNVSHYQSYALLEAAREASATPVYVYAGEGVSDLSGDQEAGPVNSADAELATQFYIGPKRIIMIGEKDSFDVVEYSGSGLSELREGIETKEMHIRSLGGKLIGNQRKMAAQSAVSTDLSNLSDQSILMGTVNNVETGFTDVIRWMLWWKDAPQSVLNSARVTMNRQFQKGQLDPREIRAFQSVFKEGLVPLDVYYEILQKSEVLDPSMSLEEFTRLVRDQDQVPHDPTDPPEPTSSPSSRPNSGVRGKGSTKPRPRQNPRPKS